MEVEMKIRGLMMDPVTNMPIVVLKDVAGDAVLPIWVGIYEANAIALEIEKVSTPRPMTHDLIKNLINGLEARVHKIVVNELRDDTFFAVIWLEREGQIISIDSRPSDALAVALRVDCPIFVDESVLKNSKLASSISERVSSDELQNVDMALDAAVYRDDDCEHQLGHVFLGNISAIADVRQELKHLLASDSLLLTRVVYDGTHTGDSLASAELPELLAEISVAEQQRPSPHTLEFLRKLRQIAQVAQQHRRPLMF
jgi:bifunctional DNase/RNase